MIFTETPVKGAYQIDLEKREDQRGFFARLFCDNEFTAQGLESSFVQANTSLTREKGTLRGMHYQLGSYAETKLVRCLQGALWDVVLDLRPDSPSFKQSYGLLLTPDNRTMLYVPQGCAHGILSLEDDTEILYLVSAAYAPQGERGIRWDDPYFSIAWPAEVCFVSPKDAAHPDFDPAYHLDWIEQELLV